ncbi:hypothetical protein D3C76_1661390 [compost metagenome]
MDLLSGELGSHGLQSAIRLSGPNPHRQPLFARAHSGHHVLPPLRGMNRRRYRHPRQVEQIVVAQHLQFGHQQHAQLLAQRQVGTVGRFLFCRHPDP